MIYKKDANFPYPVLANTSLNYENNTFTADIEINEDTDNYYFQLTEVEIESEFIQALIRNKKAQYVLVIQAKDNKFYKLKSEREQIEIPKSRISLNKRTSIQVHLQAAEDISFADNNDLNSFYDAFKDQISVTKYGLLGFSNVLVLEGRYKKPLELFNKRIDPDLSSEIKIELGNETIDICFRNPDFQMNDVRKSSHFNYPYIYIGLQKALQRFIFKYGEDGEDVDLERMEVPDDLLDQKLFNLMQNKSISELSAESVDKAIYAISDNIIEKYTATVREVSTTDGD